MKNKELIKKEGITLIALVITIIVLLILAGVTISALSGDNGILTRASEAKEKTEQADKDEKIELARTEDLINEYVNGTGVEQVTDENPGVLETEATDIYIINSIEDLVFFAYDVKNGNTYEGQTVKLGLNLDFNSTKSYVDPLRTDYGEYGYNGELKTLLTSGEGFLSIGDESSEFAGTFNGLNHILANVNIEKQNVKNNEYIGLFKQVSGQIMNLNLNVNINTSVEQNIIFVGGIAGFNCGTIVNCKVSGNIKIKSTGTNTDIRAGGIVGQSNNKKFEKCLNQINIEIDDGFNVSVGGVLGYGDISNEVNSCTNTGNITVRKTQGSIKIGGVLGFQTVQNRMNFENSYNTGNINVQDCSGDCVIGGVVGQHSNNQEMYIKNVYNKGDIIMNNSLGIDLGGIVGYFQYGTLENAYNIGNINANIINIEETCNVGGIVGMNAGNIDNSYNIGILETVDNNATVNAGSIVGINNSTSATIVNSYSNIEIEICGANFGMVDIDSTGKKEELPKVLDVINSDGLFTQNENDDYPVLKWI